VKTSQEQASRFAAVSTAALVVGGASMAAAVGLWLGAPAPTAGHPATLRLVPTVGVGRAGLGVVGVF
jgi:hypothetical protein